MLATAGPDRRARLLRAAWQRAAAAFARRLPPACACCGLHPGDPLCEGCRADWFTAGEARCARCAAAVPSRWIVPVCGRCRTTPPAFDAAFAAADYAPPVDGMLLALKFGQRLDLARPFGVLLAERVEQARATHPDGDPRAAAHGSCLLVAMPLSFERQRERGYNQAHEIARIVARRLGVPLREALLRVREAPRQEGLDSEARRANVRGAFVARGLPAGSHVLLVDDVLTTGATADAAALALRAGGARRVTVLAACRTP